MPRIEPLHPIFKGCLVYGPYYVKKKDRYQVTLKRGLEPPTTLPYARFLWINHHGIWPKVGHDIDHINNNRTDNRIENLQCIPTKENALKFQSLRDTLWVHLKCPWCEKDFIWPHANSHLGYGKSNRGIKYSCCSKSCAMYIRNRYRGYTNLEFEGNVIRVFTAAPNIPKE